MDAPVPLIIAAAFAAFALAAPSARARAASMLAALAITPAILYAHVHDNDAFDVLRDHPALLAAAVVAGLAALAGVAVLLHRRPGVLPVAAVAALPFRIPIEAGGSTSNLLIPLYLVVGAGVLAFAVPRLRMLDDPDAGEPEPRWLERLLAASILLYAVQATYSSDFDRALENVVFFYVPFVLLYGLLRRVNWTMRLAAWSLGVLVGLAAVFVAIGFVEYATRELLLNPKVITSNQFEEYFRVNSLFFDPNIYGRFLAIVMLGVAAVVLWSSRDRTAVLGGLVLALLWAGLVLTFSQSSFAALLAGLAVLGGLRWSARRAWAAVTALIVVGVALVAFAPSAIRVDIGDAKSADKATSGRYDLIEGGAGLFGDEPLVGHGAGAFAREYRSSEQASRETAASASHTIPVTVAAEQGLLGLVVYLALLIVALRTLLRGSRASVARAAVAAAFVGLLVHTMLYAAFLEDPLAWALLAAGAALPPNGAGVREPAPVAPQAPATAATADG